MMEQLSKRRYSISEASEHTGVPAHLLRQWEEKITHLRPKRSRTGRRYYNEADLDIIRRIKYLTRHEKMTLEGARLRIAQEIHGEGRPRSTRDMIDRLDDIESNVRDMLDLLDSI